MPLLPNFVYVGLQNSIRGNILYSRNIYSKINPKFLRSSIFMTPLINLHYIAKRTDTKTKYRSCKDVKCFFLTTDVSQLTADKCTYIYFKSKTKEIMWLFFCCTFMKSNNSSISYQNNNIYYKLISDYYYFF